MLQLGKSRGTGSVATHPTLSMCYIWYMYIIIVCIRGEGGGQWCDRKLQQNVYLSWNVVIQLENYQYSYGNENDKILKYLP